VRRDLAAIATMLGVMSIIGTADALASASVSNSPGAPPALDPVTVESRPHDRDEKPYRNLLKAITVFEENRPMAPEAVMRLKVFPWRNPSIMQGLTLTLRGHTIRRGVALAADGSFKLERDPQAVDDSAWVVAPSCRRPMAAMEQPTAGASVPLRKRQAQLKRKSLESPDDPNGQQTWISTGRIEAFIFAAHGK
jgi:hypothetical protein